MNYKVIVAHPGKQHSFRLAAALKNNGVLFKYVTTVYDKENSLIMKMLKKIVSVDNKKRANSRKCCELDDCDVVQFCELMGLVEIFLARIDKKRKMYNWWHTYTSDRFGKKVAKLAIKENVDAVIIYDTNAKSCFEYLKKKAPHIKRIMDSSAANRLFMKTVYEKDMSICPEFANKLRIEVAELWDKKWIEICSKEIELTEFFLVPSKFVRKSFLYSNVLEKNIFVCSYGTNFIPEKPAMHSEVKKCLKAVYVGNVTEMKGIYYLLEAFNKIPHELVQLTVVGAYDNSSHIFDKYMEFVTFTGRIQHDEVKKVLQKSDFFVFPSLGEGLSLSVLEALACGLPCIVSEHSGANDAIIEEKNGFVVPIQNIEVLIEKIMWFVNNPELLSQLKMEAYESSLMYSWDNYSYSIGTAIKQILDINS